MVTDQEISQAVQSLFRDSNPRRTFSTLNEVVQELQAKLGVDLTNKLDFITNQINLLFGSHPPRPPPKQQPSPLPQQQNPQLQPLPKDHFALRQNPNFETAPAPVTSALQSFASHPAPVKPDASTGGGTCREPPAIVGTEAPKEGYGLNMFSSSFVSVCLC